MRLDARRVPAFLRDPGACRVVLLYGDDEGLIRERANALVRAVAGALDDPFRVAELGRDALAGLPEEAAALSLMGGRRVVRLREATDTAAGPVKSVLAGKGEALVVVEAGGLASRSRLRGIVEGAPDGAAIGCYPEEGRALAASIRAGLAEQQVTIEPDALEWVAAQLGADRALTRQEIGKLALWAGPGGAIDLQGATRCVGDVAELSAEDALFAATAGDLAAADRALDRALEQGAAPVSTLRAALFHMQRLHQARLAVAAGETAEAATRGARPPVFWRRTAAFTRALQRWSPDAIAAALDRLMEAERACKRTGAPAEAICRHAVLELAGAARMDGVSPGA